MNIQKLKSLFKADRGWHGRFNYPGSHTPFWGMENDAMRVIVSAPDDPKARHFIAEVTLRGEEEQLIVLPRANDLLGFILSVGERFRDQQVLEN